MLSGSPCPITSVWFVLLRLIKIPAVKSPESAAHALETRLKVSELVPLSKFAVSSPGGPAGAPQSGATKVPSVAISRLFPDESCAIVPEDSFNFQKASGRRAMMTWSSYLVSAWPRTTRRKYTTQTSSVHCAERTASSRGARKSLRRRLGSVPGPGERAQPLLCCISACWKMPISSSRLKISVSSETSVCWNRMIRP